MQSADRISAFLAYLLLVIGWVYVLLFRRKNQFAMYHTRQSIMLILTALGGFVVWVVFGWVVMLIPVVGPVTTMSAFSLVIALFFALFASWIVGMVYALQAKAKPIPFVGRWAEQLPIG